MDSIYEEQVGRYLEEKGWKLYSQKKIRGMQADFLAERDGELAIIEVKGERADLENGIKKVLHFKKAVNYSYLAIPDQSVTGKMVDVCRALGVGLIGIGKESKEIVKPERTKALESVKNKVYQNKEQKPKTRKKGLLETLFKSKPFVYVLNFLFLNQSREYYLNELAYQAKVSAPTVLRELERIESLNIISKTRMGNTTYYGINGDCIIYEELKHIFLKFELTDEIISEELDKFNIKYALIFGSFARGAEKESSDIDLLIIGNVEKNILLRSISELESKIGREINAIIWKEEIFQDKIRQNISLLNNIKNNEIIMIRGNENEFKQSIT